MFTNATVYRYKGTIDPAALPEFEECSPSQEQSAGFVPPRTPEGSGPLMEHGSLLLYRVDTKTVPKRAIDKIVDRRAREIEDATGRKPGKKERRDLAEDARQSLLPLQTPRTQHAFVWLRASVGQVVIDSTSQGLIDMLASVLVQTHENFILHEIHTNLSPTAGMSAWLCDLDQMPATLVAGRACKLVASDASKAKVRYDDHPLDVPEIRKHVAEGKLPVSMALEAESEVTFVMTDDMQLRKLEYPIESGGRMLQADGFDADVVLVQAALGKTIDIVVNALGGEVTL